MNGGIEKLTQKRRKWVEATRENGFEEGFKQLLTEIYPDNAHFIYELLQNAEDTCASVVRFTLNTKELVFEHNGNREFSFADVDSITSIGVSTKRDDPTSIGKFGVGFKAVFTYTNTPEVHSGELHFRIVDLVIPETIGIKQPRMGERETRFNFPFNRPKKPSEQATVEIEQGLRVLSDNTLLFLKYIRKIEYRLPDGSLGSLERIDHKNGHIEIRASHPGGNDTNTHWLRFQKDVKVVVEGGGQKTCGIAVAYSFVNEEDKKKGNSAWRIDPIEHGQVSIYFPAEKETSNLRFHLHAPFASTVARDSVRDCEANRELRNHIADLVVESLAAIRDQGMLTVGFLAVLPNPQDNLTDFYEPIREAIVQAFKHESLTPTRSGSHAPAESLYRGPPHIQEVLDDDCLTYLTDNKSSLWAKNSSQQNSREDRFLDSLDIDEWGWDELASASAIGSLVDGWIADKDDAWLMRFYALLGDAVETQHKYVDARELRIVRVEAAQSSEHVTPREAFFPSDQGTAPPPDVYFVKPAVYSVGRSEAQKKSAASFLQDIGVRHFDAEAAVELKLAQYGRSSKAVVDNNASYYKDIEQFVDYWKNNPTEVYLFTNHAFLFGDSSLEPRKPEHLCLDSPYLETGLSELTSIHGRAAIYDGYHNNLHRKKLKDFTDFLKAIGVMYALKVESDEFTTYDNPRSSSLRIDYRRRVIRSTSSGIDEDYSIINIEEYLAIHSISASRLIWNALVEADARSAIANFRPNQNYQTRSAPSQLICHLKRHAWIPNKSGEFCKPCDMTKDDLRTDFPYDDRNGLLTAVGFGENLNKRSEEYQVLDNAARSIGFASAAVAEKWAKLDKLGVSPDEILTQKTHVIQPEESVPDPTRRREGVLERQDNAPTRESVKTERKIQPGILQVVAEAKAYLRAKYTNHEKQLVCQCCHLEMPFKVHDVHYFEAVQCMKGLDQHHFVNRLALCPNCSAMYQHAKETGDDEMRRRIISHDAPDTTPSVEIPVTLAGKEYKLRFVGVHWFDLTTILDKP